MKTRLDPYSANLLRRSPEAFLKGNVSFARQAWRQYLVAKRAGDGMAHLFLAQVARSMSEARIIKAMMKGGRS